MTSNGFFLRTTRESDYPLLRAFRIGNATEHPISYGATLETTLALTEEDWRIRARRGEEDRSTSVVAIERSTGSWIGMMAAHEDALDSAALVLTGVYVVPAHRGTDAGVADSLLTHVLDWAMQRGREHIRLDVYETSTPARRFYERHGFSPTGRTRPHGFAEDAVLELVRPLVP